MQQKVHLMRSDEFCALIGLEPVVDMLIALRLSIDGPTEVRYEDARFPRWDDITYIYPSRSPPQRICQVKRKHDHFERAEFLEVVRDLPNVVREAFAIFTIPVFSYVRNIGSLNALARMCERLHKPRIDLEAFPHTCSREQRDWLETLSQEWSVERLVAMNTLSRLAVDITPPERLLLTRLKERLALVSTSPDALLDRLRNAIRDSLDSCAVIDGKFVLEVATPFLDLPSPDRRPRQGDNRPVVVIDYAANEPGSRYDGAGLRVDWEVHPSNTKSARTWAPYAKSLEAGGPVIQEFLPLGLFAQRRLALDIRVANQSQSRTRFLTAATLQVDRSILDPTPVPIVGSTWDAFDGRRLRLFNYGWGVIQDLEISGVATLGSGNDTTQVDYNFEVPAVDRTHLFMLDQLVEKAGYDLERILEMESKGHFAAWDPGLPMWYSRDSSTEVPSPFGENDIHLRGRMKYSFERASKRVFVDAPFEATAELCTLAHQRAFGETQISANRLLQFRSADTNYSLRAPLSYVISPGEMVRFRIWLTADRSSSHRFGISLQLDGDDVDVGHDYETSIFISRFESDFDEDQIISQRA